MLVRLGAMATIDAPTRRTCSGSSRRSIGGITLTTSRIATAPTDLARAFGLALAASEIGVFSRPTFMGVAVKLRRIIGYAARHAGANIMVMDPSGYSVGDYWTLSLCLTVV